MLFPAAMGSATRGDGAARHTDERVEVPDQRGLRLTLMVSHRLPQGGHMPVLCFSAGFDEGLVARLPAKGVRAIFSNQILPDGEA
jgi:hypothetical protein